MTYQEAVDWIHSHQRFAKSPSLERMRYLLAAFDNPQDKLASVHIVGTNGKGSTTSYLQHIFSQAGYKVGTFTSPYMVDFRERISINGQMIAKKDLLTLVEMVKPVVERLPKESSLEPATTFEVITLIMFLYFGQLEPVDIAFIEAGIGGRHDSTNCLTPLALICTSIGLDHQAVLGRAHAQIASQKVGALKAGVPFIYANSRAEVEVVFEKAVAQLKSPAYKLGREFQISSAGKSFSYQFGNYRIADIVLPMPGQHQRSNASLAITTSFLLSDRYPKISSAIIKKGIEQTIWAGRTELLRANLMVDGAHNQESVDALLAVMRELTDKPVKILFAALADKPVASMLASLESIGQVTVTSFNAARALALEDYSSSYTKVTSWQTWLDQTTDDDTFYLVTGSLYFISQVRTYMLGKDE